MRKLLSSVFVFVLLIGCSALRTDDQVGTASKAMLGTRAAIISMAESADHFCTQGTLTQSQCDKVSKVYSSAKRTYDLAADAMVVAIESSEQPGTWEAYRAYHEKFLDLYMQMTDLAIEFDILPGIEKGTE